MILANANRVVVVHETRKNRYSKAPSVDQQASVHVLIAKAQSSLRTWELQLSEGGVSAVAPNMQDLESLDRELLVSATHCPSCFFNSALYQNALKTPITLGDKQSIQQSLAKLKELMEEDVSEDNPVVSQDLGPELSSHTI